MIVVRSQDQIVSLPAASEIFPRVIDEMDRADRSRDLQIPCAANGCDFSPEGFGDLDCKRADAAGGAINQNLVAGLNPSLVAKALESCDCRDKHGARLLKRQIRSEEHTSELQS